MRAHFLCRHGGSHGSVAYGLVQSRRWKWIGLGTLAAIAVGSVVVAQKRRRKWRNYDTDEIRTRLQDRFAALDESTAHQSPESDLTP
jgi:hypothetical protein